MKLASYELDGRQSYGTVANRGLCDARSVWPDGPRTMLELLQAGRGAVDKLRALVGGAAEIIPINSVKLLAPVPNPPKVIGLAVNYAEHHREWSRGEKLPDDPSLNTTPRPFLMPGTCVIGPGAAIPWPRYSRQIDYEVELAVVIGSPASCVSPDQAARHIAGYTIANDISARSVTYSEGRTPRPKDDFFDWLQGKWADGFCPTGPWLATPDEVGDVQDLDLELTVNGQIRQKSNTSKMIFSVFEQVSFISHIMTLFPGDIIATGTPSGVALATGNYLRGGDVIACRIERIGELTNTLGQPPQTFYAPCRKP